MKMDYSDGTTTVCSISSRKDSGFDNGFLSDSSSSSSSNQDCRLLTCVYEKNTNVKLCSNHLLHKCALNCYCISERSIETISPKTFLYLTSCVRVLDLCKNKIKILPETISELKNLEELNLSYNDLVSFPKSCKVLHKLQVLNLSHNKLSKPPQCLMFGMGRLTHLDLSGNNICEFPNPPMCLPSLQVLNLSHNCLNVLPLWLFSEQCRSIVELDMSFNFCFDSPTLQPQLLLLKHHRTSILKSLKKLSISNTGTKLEMVSPLSSFESLQSLYIGNLPGPESTFNYFWEIPMNFFYNPCSIIELFLPKIGLAGLPNDFHKLQNLEVLDASYNPLDWLPETFWLLKSLRELVLTDCNLSYLPDNFSQMKGLKKLVLNHNKLTDVFSSVSGLPILEYLDLYDNCLEELPLLPDQLINLHMVDLASNYFNLELALDFQVHGEKLFDIYNCRQSKLRQANGFNMRRQDGFKIFSNSQSAESDYKSDSSDSLSEVSQDHCIQDKYYAEENWDEDSSNGNDGFEPDSVKRYFLPAGQFRFGWTPPLKYNDCFVPICVTLSEFVYVPGQAHAKTSQTQHKKVHQLPVAEGQFEDADVDGIADLQKTDTLGELLKQKLMFVRNHQGPNLRQCKLCDVYTDCWHFGYWMRF